MAKAIEYQPAKYDRRQELFHKLQNAPQEHLEALLDGYEILELLRQKGILEIVKGTLGSGEKVLGELTKTIETTEVISLIRNATILIKILGGLNPHVLEELERTLSQQVHQAEKGKPPGIFSLLRRFSSEGTRRFVGSAMAVMNTLGNQLAQAEEPGLRGEKRKKTTRHRVSYVEDDPRA